MANENVKKAKWTMTETRTSSAIALEGLILTTDTLNESRVRYYQDDM